MTVSHTDTRRIGPSDKHDRALTGVGATPGLLTHGGSTDVRREADSSLGKFRASPPPDAAFLGVPS